MYYTVNYGYIPNIVAGDGEEIGVHMEESFIIYQSKFGDIEIRYKDDKITFMKKVSKEKQSQG
ncbi:hypothetical protein [Terrisporobacter vanillatitrophus]|uniref:hypothetical protein n=1 Tax=Terrisporobacter vanillatitrophus TaxID=3058402 RepID=UPI003367460F